MKLQRFTCTLAACLGVTAAPAATEVPMPSPQEIIRMRVVYTVPGMDQVGSGTALSTGDWATSPSKWTCTRLRARG
jgi:hypothetical protein